MFLKIDQMSSKPLYLQIRDQIVEAVAHGVLKPGDALPSVRSLGTDLGINLHTVNKAYALLRDEGYVLMRGRGGAHVADFEHFANAERSAEADSKLAQTLYQLALEHKARGGSYQGFMDLANAQASEAYEKRVLA